MYNNTLLEQENNEDREEFIYRVQEFLNNNISNSYTKLINLQWIKDDESYYPYSCIVTYYKELS